MYDMILALGMFLVIAGFLMFTFSPEGTESILYVLLPVLSMICGAVFLFFTMVFSHNAYHLFFGILFSLCGFFFTLVANKIVPYTFKEWWPLAVIFIGVSVFAAGCYRKQKVIVKFTFPSLLFVAMGMIFLLFSFHVIRVSFYNFVLIFGPFALMASGVFMIVLFLLQRKYNQFYVEEEIVEIAEDEDIFLEQSDTK